jgi:ABC-type uncharacterized transport system permease subunit
LIQKNQKRVKKKLWNFLQPCLSVISGLTLGLFITKLAGENPWNILQILFNSAFGTPYDLGMTLFYTTPLIFTGLSVSFAFQAGLFNIGAEGQLACGALAAAAVGVLFPHIPAPYAPILAGVVAFAAGAAWGAIPGWLRARRGSHEVINTIMLNFIAAGLCSWVTLYLLKTNESQNPETAPVAPAYLIGHIDFFGGAPVSIALLVAFLAVFLYWIFFWKTALGYEIRAVGHNEFAAKAAGIDSARVRIFAMVIAGGLSGLVAVSEVLGSSGCFKLGFSPGYGFMGIAVALLGRNRPIGILASALLFAALHKGTADLDLETENITRDFSLILQALVILCVSATGLWTYLGKFFFSAPKPKSNGRSA